ncbi:MAG: hypothetical protein WA847_16685 [Terriglobales bacterium]
MPRAIWKSTSWYAHPPLGRDGREQSDNSVLLHLRFEPGWGSAWGKGWRLNPLPLALGRKNWIHIGSPQAGPKVGAILVVVESCRRLRLPVRDYLAEVLPGLAGLPIQRLPNLTPAARVAQHS